jgi:hypothetical protein
MTACTNVRIPILVSVSPFRVSPRGFGLSRITLFHHDALEKSPCSSRNDRIDALYPGSSTSADDFVAALVLNAHWENQKYLDEHDGTLVFG